MVQECCRASGGRPTVQEVTNVVLLQKAVAELQSQARREAKLRKKYGECLKPFGMVVFIEY